MFFFFVQNNEKNNIPNNYYKEKIQIIGEIKNILNFFANNYCK